jgi:hypothetical protein
MADQPDATSTQGVYIGTSDGGSPANYAELARVTNIGGPNETMDELDVTHLRSTGMYREFIPNFKDGGELPITMQFGAGSASQLALMAEFESTPPPTQERRMFFPDGSTATFNAFVKARNSPVAVGGVLELNVTLRISGPVVWDRVSVSPASL